jgi:hypothetical protein
MSQKKNQSMLDQMWATVLGLVVLGVVGGALLWFLWFLLTGRPAQ